MKQLIKSRNRILILLLILLSIGLKAQTFQKTYSTYNSSSYVGQIRSMEKLSDGGYIMCGNVFNPNNYIKQGLVIRLNANGDTLWTKNYHTVVGDTNLLLQSIILS